MTDIQKPSAHLSGTEQTLVHFQRYSGPNYEPNANLEAQLEQKIEQAILASGKDPKTMTEAELAEIVQAIPLTEHEVRYTAEQNIYRLAQVAIGERIVKALDEHCKVAHGDIIPCLRAYFGAKANGELDAA